MTGVFAALRLALKALVREPRRTVLTCLGILIGIAAVVVVVALGQGARQRVGDQLQSLGSNLIYVFPQPTAKSGVRTVFSGPGGLTLEDAEAIRREATAVREVSIYRSIHIAAASEFADDQIDVVGTDEHYLDVRGYSLSSGRNFTPEEVSTKAKFTLIGKTVQDKLFGGEDPLGRSVRIGRHTYRVIGVMKSKGESPFGVDQDDRLIVPIGSWFARIAPSSVKQLQIIMGSARSADLSGQAEQQILEIMRQRHAIAEGQVDDFQIRTQRQFQETQDNVTGVISALLLSVATIALFVGGVGVMNILLVSVNERKREIGIRMAVGARPADVRMQFLAEAIALTFLGGILGLLLAGLVVVGMQDAFGGILAFDWVSVAVALSVSLIVGVLFGFLPAHRAAALDPIEALRHE
ncbi:MAG TPA: ABC transporter permease [Polyangiaceae bacterium]|nr:ABC transporter permease [Polyangiaceae bacterium]